ncbi:MAG TPA: hypothetical protein VN845_08165 [Solirubrobacteraceae bacterium]|nr:hypothetical protein [Solirubrobacteraceae bacterium]
MAQSAELEAAIMARRVEIHALRAEARRVEESQAEGNSGLVTGITVPSGWLAALVHGLAFLIRKWELEEAEERAAGNTSATDPDDAELSERMRSLASTIREVEPGNAYTVSPCDYEALFKGIVAALHIQEFELQSMSKYVNPSVLRFVAIEQRDALARFYSVLDDLLDRLEER